MSENADRPLIETVLQIALDAHSGQVDKAGLPYIRHPLRLMARAETEEQKVTALLHDVIEDSDQTPESLREAGVPAHIVEAVDVLTKRDGEDYEAFISRVMENQLAASVKIRDVEDNMQVQRLNRPLEEADLQRLARYQRSWLRLKRALEADS